MLIRMTGALARFYARRAIRVAGRAQVGVPGEADLACAALEADDLAFVAGVAAQARDWSQVVECTREAREAARRARALSAVA